MRLFLIYVASWLGMMVIAIINGWLREATYGKSMSKLSAHQISTVTGISLFAIYIYMLTGIWKLQSPAQALLVGVIWLLMTVAFEFGFGHYIMKHPWQKLFEDYNLRKGRVWVLVLIWVTIAPYIFFVIRS
jgi:hypothetical protein